MRVRVYWFVSLCVCVFGVCGSVCMLVGVRVGVGVWGYGGGWVWGCGVGWLVGWCVCVWGVWGKDVVVVSGHDA